MRLWDENALFSAEAIDFVGDEQALIILKMSVEKTNLNFIVIPYEENV